MPKRIRDMVADDAGARLAFDTGPAGHAARARNGNGSGRSNGGGAGAGEPRRATRRTGGRRRPGAVVAGGAGFLGSHLCARLLAEGYRVYCIDSFETGLGRNIAPLRRDPRFVLLEHDIRDGVPAIAEVDEVYNLACPASPPHYQRDPVHTMTTNVLGTLNLLEMAAQRGARFLLASTSEVYGEPEVHPQPESYRGNVSTTGPRACYDEGKRAAEALAYDFLRLRRADVRACRIFNTYGPHMRADDGRIISNFVTQALRGEPMTVYGDGRQTRSFCYVSDLIEGMLRLMRVAPPPAGPVNLGNPGEYTILEVAEMVTRLTGSNVPIEHRPLPADDPTRRRPDIALARRLLDWQPGVGLDEGLARTIAWFAEAEPERNGRGAVPAAGSGRASSLALARGSALRVRAGTQ